MKRRSSKGGGLDPERMVRAAIAAYMDGAPAGRGDDATDTRAHRGGRKGALALGVVIGIGARAVYRRVRELDLERVARAVERRMVN